MSLNLLGMIFYSCVAAVCICISILTVVLTAWFLKEIIKDFFD